MNHTTPMDMSNALVPPIRPENPIVRTHVNNDTKKTHNSNVTIDTIAHEPG